MSYTDIFHIYPILQEFITVAQEKDFKKTNIYIPKIENIAIFLDKEKDLTDIPIFIPKKMTDAGKAVKLLDMINVYLTVHHKKTDIFQTLLGNSVPYLTDRLRMYDRSSGNIEITVCLVHKANSTSRSRYAIRLSIEGSNCSLDFFQITCWAIASASSEVYY